MRGKSGKDVGAILRDDQTLGAFVKRLSDNDRFAVQFLDTEESVTSKDAVISLTLWRPLLQSLEKKIEVVVSKCVTTLELHEKLVRLYGDNWCVGASDSLALVEANYKSVIFVLQNFVHWVVLLQKLFMEDRYLERDSVGFVK